MNLRIEDVVLREATTNDIPTLQIFEQNVISAERPFDPTIKAETHYYNLPLMISSGDIRLIVAVWQNALIASGYARIEASRHFLEHSHHSYLGFMFVLPEFRGLGVNRLVIEDLKKWSYQKGITEMKLEVYQDNISAIKSYEKAGFTKLLVEMRYEITQPPDENRIH